MIVALVDLPKMVHFIIKNEIIIKCTVISNHLLP